MIRLSLIAFLSLSVVACAHDGIGPQAAAHQPRQCPLGATTEIQATGPAPRDMALNMAAQATLRDGFQKFTIVRGGPINQGRSYNMLIRMARFEEATDPSQTVMAGALLGASTQI